MPISQTVLTALRKAGECPDDALDLAETALLLAALDMPDTDLNLYRKHLEDLSRDVAEAGAKAKSNRDHADVLSRIIGDVYGYDGDQLTFDNPYNANLISVIERRRGLPVTLGILYLHAGRAQGWLVNGLNFPGHFLVCVGEGESMEVLDPFHSGRILSENELQGFMQRVRGTNPNVNPSDLGVMSARSILIRLLSNIKQRAIQSKDDMRALEIAERLVIIAPEQPTVLYEFAMLNAQAGHLSLALECLANAATHSRDEAFRRKVLSTLDSLKRRLN